MYFSSLLYNFICIEPCADNRIVTGSILDAVSVLMEMNALQKSNHTIK